MVLGWHEDLQHCKAVNRPSNDPKVMQTALYFDTINFASRIKARSLVAMGFIDTIASPADIWTALN